MEKQKFLFQKYFATIRRSSGWTAAILGAKLGVTRQMVSALETGKAELNTIQYRALRNTFDEEIVKHPDETCILQDILTILVDYPDQFTDEEKDKLLMDANSIGLSICAHETTRKAASLAWQQRRSGNIAVKCANLRPHLIGTTSAIIAATKVQRGRIQDKLPIYRIKRRH